MTELQYWHGKMFVYEGRLQSLWTYLITLSQNFVEVL